MMIMREKNYPLMKTSVERIITNRIATAPLREGGAETILSG
jgi:hypothetical protein